MKKNFLIVVFVFVIFNCFSQRPYDDFKRSAPIRNSIIKTNPFTILVGNIPLTGEYRIGYEFANSPSQATQISISYIGKSVFWSSLVSQDSLLSPIYNEFDINGFRVQAMQKFYWVRKKAQAPKGFYVGPHASYSNVRFSLKRNSKDYVSITYMNVNVLAGYQFLIKRFTIDVFTGLGYKWNTARYHIVPGSNQRAIDGEAGREEKVKPSLGVNFGWLF